jgi:hypothetical protein
MTKVIVTVEKKKPVKKNMIQVSVSGSDDELDEGKAAAGMKKYGITPPAKFWWGDEEVPFKFKGSEAEFKKALLAWMKDFKFKQDGQPFPRDIGEEDGSLAYAIESDKYEMGGYFHFGRKTFLISLN